LKISFALQSNGAKQKSKEKKAKRCENTFGIFTKQGYKNLRLSKEKCKANFYLQS